jgi:NAD-dependent SIR2 family protein deacetylase
MPDRESYQRAAAALEEAEALVVTAGAGIGVDSGLPDFRGDKGFWKAYPMYARLGLSFVNAANPVHFDDDPAFGWGFYGHRVELYRSTVPHRGFKLLQEWREGLGLDCFVVTSNVDGQFQKAGFGEDAVAEIHGSIHHLQCTTPCHGEIWPNEESFRIDHSTMRADHVPECPGCGRAARPNVLMFGDWAWLPQRTSAQEGRFGDFCRRQEGKRVVVVEMGAGTGLPTIRHMSESLGRRFKGTVVRINPREAHISGGHVSLSCGALEGLSGIAAELSEP